MGEHSKTGISAALTATTESVKTDITIQGKSGDVYTLTKVEVQNFPTLETVVNSGGKVRLINDATDWQPFEFYTPSISCVTSGGVEIDPFVLKCNVPLPAGSTTSCYFTPYDDQSQKFAVSLVYTKAPFSGKKTRFLAAMGTAVTQTTISSAQLTFTVPSTKGGEAISINLIVLGTLETVVDSGGLVALRSQSMVPEAIEPLERYTRSGTVVTAGAAVAKLKEISLAGYTLADKAIVDVDYTPQDDQSQKLAGFLAWLS